MTQQNKQNLNEVKNTRPNSIVYLKSIFKLNGSIKSNIKSFLCDLWNGLLRPYIKIRYILLVVFTSSIFLATFYIFCKIYFSHSEYPSIFLQVLRMVEDSLVDSPVYIWLPIVIIAGFFLLVVWKYSQIHRIHKQVDSFIVLFHTFSLISLVFLRKYINDTFELDSLKWLNLLVAFGIILYIIYSIFIIYCECTEKYKKYTRYTSKDFPYDPQLDYRSNTLNDQHDVQPLFHGDTQNYIKQHLDTKNPQVKVVLIDAEQGQGKSYFTTQLIHRLLRGDFNDDSHINSLFTYFSLTEINKDIDLSSLFIKRWEATLARRYPVLNKNLFSVNTFAAITGNVNIGVAHSILALIKSFANIPLVQAVSKINNQKLDPEVADIFCNISCIKEDAWYIVFDEIDRSPVQELLRTIEIIERFKELSKKHLPIKINFILCADVSKIVELIDKNSEVYPELSICKDFLFEGGKSLTLTVNLPPVLDNYKEKIIRDIFQDKQAHVFLNKFDKVKSVLNKFYEDLSIRDCYKIGLGLSMLSKQKDFEKHVNKIDFYTLLECISYKYPLVWQGIIKKFYPQDQLDYSAGVDYGQGELQKKLLLEIIQKTPGLEDNKRNKLLGYLKDVEPFNVQGDFKIFCDKYFGADYTVNKAKDYDQILRIEKIRDNLINN